MLVHVGMNERQV